MLTATVAPGLLLLPRRPAAGIPAERRAAGCIQILPLLMLLIMVELLSRLTVRIMLRQCLLMLRQRAAGDIVRAAVVSYIASGGRTRQILLLRMPGALRRILMMIHHRCRLLTALIQILILNTAIIAPDCVMDQTRRVPLATAARNPALT
ncbi:hypothetical protein A8A01_08750 [Ewingella americana]|nr:hypothetical protein A8A01_08750 [Ewingella americana]